MIRTLALTIMLALTLLAVPPQAFAGQPLASSGVVAGIAQNQTGRVMTGTSVRIRNLATQQIMGYTTSNAAGGFSFAGLAPGLYLVEVVNQTGQVVGTSTATMLADGAMRTSHTAVTAAQSAAATGGGSSFFTSTLGIVTLVAIAGGVAAITVAATRGTASPSQ